jgi:hypothetical protein
VGEGKSDGDDGEEEQEHGGDDDDHARVCPSGAVDALATSQSAGFELGKVPDAVNENIARVSENVPNAWLAVSHTDDLKPGGLKRIWVDDQPIALFRLATGEVRPLTTDRRMA